eukprot:scaffold566820_cov13-Prasinocladus_malaysianus.AAC.1
MLMLGSEDDSGTYLAESIWQGRAETGTSELSWLHVVQGSSNPKGCGCKSRLSLPATDANVDCAYLSGPAEERLMGVAAARCMPG